MLWIFASLIAAFFLGAAWRRWFGSERPTWAFKGYRGAQVGAGILVLFALQLATKEPLWRHALDAALAIGFMTLPIAFSRQPFVFLANKLNPPKMWGTMLNGPEPWAEVIQGACLWSLAVVI